LLSNTKIPVDRNGYITGVRYIINGSTSGKPRLISLNKSPKGVRKIPMDSPIIINPIKASTPGIKNSVGGYPRYHKAGIKMIKRRNRAKNIKNALIRYNE